MAATATLLAWAPTLSSLFANGLAGALGCSVSVASDVPCPGPFGMDARGTIKVAGAIGLLIYVTFPMMLATVILWVGLGVLAMLRLFRR